MTTAMFLSAVLALLLAPGPTNTLMGLAGAQEGLTRVLRLIPAELAGYATAILPLSLLGAELAESFPAFSLVLKVVAAIWIAVLAVRLWRASATQGAGNTVSMARVYVTTCLNPKALIFSLVLLPAPGSAAFLPHLALFGVMVAAVALVWGGMGAMTRSTVSGEKRLVLLQRLASAWLLFVSLSLVVNVVKV